MAARENLPKIVTDVQDLVRHLCEEFNSAGQPITDDSHNLHKLCAKLEFLFTSSIKEKSLLGNKRSYWSWIYACLKNAKGLNDGLRYVQAYKEVHSSKGRGRSFIRYCLVHQTLADSLQNCIMNASASSQYLHSNSVLMNPIHSSALVTALYDLNSVNFDLTSKGYDLDTGWPTFASKRTPSQVEEWAIQSHVGSLGSLTSASIVMETPHIHGSAGSSEPHSVDQRVEELVLELDQSDQKIKEQQRVISDLESKAETITKSTNEKEDILAEVISDLESKNRHLHDAMSNMSSEFQEREQQWREKHDKLVQELCACETKSRKLAAKNEQLEQDKRTLEDLVSQRMTNITNNFAADLTNAPLTPVTAFPLQSNQYPPASRLEVNSVNLSLKEELQDARVRCAELESRWNENTASVKSVAELKAHMEEKQGKIDILEAELKTLAETHQLYLKSVKNALEIASDKETEVDTIISSILQLREEAQKAQVNNQQTECVTSDDKAIALSLKEENQCLLFDREVAQMDAKNHKHKLKEMEVQVDELKVELEAVRSRSAHRIAELEEQLSLFEQQFEMQRRHHKEMFADLTSTQEALKKAERDLETTEQRCKELEKRESDLREELERTTHKYEDEICDNEFVLEELQAEMHHHASLSDSLDHALEKEKVKCSKLSGDLVVANQAVETFNQHLDETKSTLAVTEETIGHLKTELKRLNDAGALHEKQLSLVSMLIDVFLDQIRLIEESEDPEMQQIKVKFYEDGHEDSGDGNTKWETTETALTRIVQSYKTTKSELVSLEKRYSELLEESKAYTSETQTELERLREELSETQASNEIHLITIKDLSDKQKVLQEGKATKLDQIEKLEYRIEDLNESLEGSTHVADELRLRVMDDSSKKIEMEEKIKLQDEDIESLKDKITQLLLDKDTLWKEGEKLKVLLEEKPDEQDEPSWMEDDEVSNCSMCGSAFSLTSRKHHCRNCGKIFCKNCCSNWKEKQGKKIRTCDKCFNKNDLDVSRISTESEGAWNTPQMSTPLPRSREYEELQAEECEIFYDDSKDDNSSIFESRSRSNESVKSESDVSVAARKETHLPIYIERAGVTLYWEITSDKDINFKLCYAPTEDDVTRDLIPVRRIDSHIKPFTGELLARHEGVYTLILDNTYSRFTAKQVHYKLYTDENSS